MPKQSSQQQLYITTGSRQLPWFWKLTQTSQRLAFFAIFSATLTLFFINLYWAIHFPPKISTMGTSNNQNVLNAILLSAIIVHFVILGVGIISLVRNEWKWIFGYILTWTMLLCTVCIIIFVYSGEVYLKIYMLLLVFLYVVATVTYALLLKPISSNDVSAHYGASENYNQRQQQQQRRSYYGEQNGTMT